MMPARLPMRLRRGASAAAPGACGLSPKASIRWMATARRWPSWSRWLTSMRPSCCSCGKALGCEGALVCAPQVVRDHLVNRGRGFIFSTAPSPLMAAAVREALRILADEPERREGLQALVRHAEAAFSQLGIAPSGSQIVPVVLGEEARTMAAAAKLQAAGFDVRGIRPPSVPPGTSRLRISLTLNATEQDVSALAACLGEVLE